ncbi:MAG: Rieske (2Fe-2S) protein [Spirochaetia bacterium]|nr:Rieske (2Fe-2S) protein [Spirochaetia bacterium]
MDKKNEVSRKGFLRTVLAIAGLTISYGTLGAVVLRFLWPSRKDAKQKIFIALIKNIPEDQTITFSTPSGESYLLSSRVVDGQKEFFAFSNRCPHLGCKVKWESEKSRFFCPCHGGVFNQNGIAIAGPPSKAKQVLKSCELLVLDTAVYAIIGKS